MAAAAVGANAVSVAASFVVVAPTRIGVRIRGRQRRPRPALVAVGPPEPCASTATFAGTTEGEDSSDGDADLDMESLARRIESVSASESESSDAFERGLLGRVRDLAAADEAEAEMDELLASSSSAGRGTIRLPVLAFDPILPGQRLSGASEDPLFSKLLVELGLGGMFVMTSVNHAQRKLRRSGTICRIELVDVDRCREGGGGGPMDPTAVTFAVVGRRRCRVVGPAEGMTSRVGRWRRGYDPDGEEAKLGWGTERFVDIDPGCPGVLAVSGSPDDSFNTDAVEDDEGTPENAKWSMSVVDCVLREAEREGSDDSADIAKAESLLPLIDRWVELASDVRTYNNIDVVASTRRKKGEPGLHVDPSRLIKNVMSDLGERPVPAASSGGDYPTDLALWSAALINPLPPLGVAPEIRGALLEAPDAQGRLAVLERGLKRSIGNLEGTMPL